MGCILANLCRTRWSRRADASKAYVENFDKVYETLNVIPNDQDKKIETLQEAKNLMESMVKLENAFMAVFWYQILSAFHKTYLYLQKVFFLI